MRPQNLAEFVGQEHLVEKGKVLHHLIQKDQIPSMIFWGPPGSGKTTLARIIANETQATFVGISGAVNSVKDIKEIVETASQRRSTLEPKDTILFIDEIHRFNKSQQDRLLPAVESGTVILIGATTENPSFEVNSALLSRARVFTLTPLSPTHIGQIIEQALKTTRRGLGHLEIELSNEARDFLIQASNGDARTALNALELAHNLARNPGSSEAIQINLGHIQEALQQTHLIYDKTGDEHYNTISAYIKSMRAGDGEAALYYLARMVEAGEKPTFIARRMVIFASEDIGLAQPTALVVANAVFAACETIGYPECQINLALGTAYLARQPKDRSSYDAYFKALDDVKKHGNLPIPLEIRNAPTKLMQDLGYGKGYEAYTKGSLLPEKLRKKK